MSDVSVMLTSWNRPHTLLPQLQAIRSQTYQPAEVVVFRNSGLPMPKGVIGTHKTIEYSWNAGVWPRFLACMEFTTRYVAVLDDDTIPGERWLESVMDYMADAEAVYGAAGVTFPEGTRHPREYWGWSRPMEDGVQVDLIGHSWVFPRRLLQVFAALDRRGGPTCGEDMHLCFSAQSVGLPCFVTPHPESDKSIWGSLNGKLGADDKALWSTPGEEEKKLAAFNAYRADGWRLLSAP